MEKQERLFNVDSVKGLACFDIDFDNGQFIFCVTDFAEHEKTNKLELKKLMKEIPDTTNSVFNGKPVYKSYKLSDLISK